MAGRNELADPMNIAHTERSHDPSVTRHLVAAGWPEPVARALSARGIRHANEMALQTRELQAPEGLAGIGQAATVLADAIEKGRRLLVVADYDCDGATACAVAVRGLRALGGQADFLVPNRFETGYGLTPELVDLAATRKPQLIITVDNGIASVEGVARAAELGIDVLITDHHLPGSVLPAACAIVNPNQPGCGFASKHLAGVGVMFYVLLALRAEMRRRGRFGVQDQPRLDSLLDLVALGTVADLVRLDRNNRILVQAGLERIRDGRLHAGLAALFRVAGRTPQRASAADLGFALGPRINAAGRLTDMSHGIACLLEDDPDAALALAGRLDEINRERRQIEADMQEQARAAIAQAATGSKPAQACTLTVFGADWHQGVVGLVASRLKEEHHRPTIAFAHAGGGELRGSGRSIEGLHLRDALELVTRLAPSVIRRFGGHAMAAGLTIAADDLPQFTAAFEAAVRQSADPACFARTVAVDGPLAASEITPALAQTLAGIVWGQGFAEPLWVNDFQVLGQRLLKDAHLKLELELDGRRLSGIWFRRTQPLGARARLAYRPVLDEFRGQPQLSLFVTGEAAPYNSAV
jgi:single-stranded-DNA-specific exonuclease